MKFDNEQIVRELCAAAEGHGTDIEKFVSMFSAEGYMWDMASGMKFRGEAIGESIAGMVSAFPDVHRAFASMSRRKTGADFRDGRKPRALN